MSLAAMKAGINYFFTIIKTRTRLIIAPSVGMLLIAGCSFIEASSNTTTVAQTQRPSAAGVNVKQSTVVEGLEHPWGVAWLPDGSMLITERPGRLRIVRQGVLDPTPITGVPKVFVVTHTQEYAGGEISKERSRPGMVYLKLLWATTTAPSGLAFYSSDRVPSWKGDLFSGGLVSQDVNRIDLDANGNVLGEQSIKIGQRVRDVRQGPDGLLYILTDEQNGQMIRLEPAN